jgi:diaminopimelate epimerase
MRRFHKMHGLGNDFVIFDAREEELAMDCARARAIADRKTGIGCDQLILLRPSAIADVEMVIYNWDGGEVEACGNASRCVAQLIGGNLSIHTKGGMIAASADGDGAVVHLDHLALDWQSIPLSDAMDTLDMPVGWEELERPSAVNVGNPHIVFFVDDCDAMELERLGPIIETDPLFPERVNVNVATIEADNRIRLRVWERGAGLTRACGTGACATTVAAIRRGLTKGPVTVKLPGGELVIDWREGEPIRMSGPASYVFSGEIDLDALA